MKQFIRRAGACRPSRSETAAGVVGKKDQGRPNLSWREWFDWWGWLIAGVYLAGMYLLIRVLRESDRSGVPTDVWWVFGVGAGIWMLPYMALWIASYSTHRRMTRR